VKFSRAAAGHPDAVVNSTSACINESFRAIEPAQADAAKSVLWKADQALGLLAFQMRAHRRIARRHKYHSPPFVSASSESERYLIEPPMTKVRSAD